MSPSTRPISRRPSARPASASSKSTTRRAAPPRCRPRPRRTSRSEPAGTWTPSVAQTTFAQQFTAHPNINSVVTPNDDNANAVIAYLQSKQIKAKTIPTTGQDASKSGLQNILKDYQCGTVYKPIYLEAQAAAALALFLRANETPPASLVNATTPDTTLGKDIASVYTTPIWVTTDNMEATVVKDGAIKVSDL